jgi:hypothetical protein
MVHLPVHCLPVGECATSAVRPGQLRLSRDMLSMAGTTRRRARPTRWPRSRSSLTCVRQCSHAQVIGQASICLVSEKIMAATSRRLSLHAGWCGGFSLRSYRKSTTTSSRARPWRSSPRWAVPHRLPHDSQTNVVLTTTPYLGCGLPPPTSGPGPPRRGLRALTTRTSCRPPSRLPHPPHRPRSGRRLAGPPTRRQACRVRRASGGAKMERNRARRVASSRPDGDHVCAGRGAGGRTRIRTWVGASRRFYRPHGRLPAGPLPSLPGPDHSH